MVTFEKPARRKDLEGPLWHPVCWLRRADRLSISSFHLADLGGKAIDIEVIQSLFPSLMLQSLHEVITRHRRRSSADRSDRAREAPRRCGRACWRARSPACCGVAASMPARSKATSSPSPHLWKARSAGVASVSGHCAETLAISAASNDQCEQFNHADSYHSTASATGS
jgi:hypothetical protein